MGVAAVVAKIERTASGGESGPAELSFDELYQEQWWPMLRLATGLVDQVSVAEDVVQDAFAAVYRRWESINDRAAVVGYLRVCVVNHSRSALRSRIRARRNLRLVESGSVEGADSSSLLSAEHQMAREALATLPDRQREVLTLRCIAELSDADIAAATGLSLGGVRSAASRGLATLRGSLGGRL
jgi:RNA polymerase sigma factor (sigma-70 family)